MPRPLHLVCAGSRTLETLEQQFAGGQPARWQREHLVRSLYDSADRRLQAAGLYLCHDVPDSHGDERGELWLGDREGRLRAPALAGVAPPPRAAAALPGAVLAPLLVPLLRPRVLLEVRRWSLERSRRAWRNEDAKILGDILLERHDYPGGALVTVTVLPLRGYRRELSRALAAGIARAGLNALAESATAVVDAHANGPWDRPSPPAAIAPDTPAAAAIAARLAYYRAVMQANERGIGEDVDSEFLHDFRVALRRARALVQAFATFLPDAAALREGFAWLSRETSLLRDLDVWLEGFDDAGATALPALYEHLAARRQREQRRLARVLRGRRYARLQAEWGAWLAQLAAAGAPAPPLRALVARALRRRHRRLCRRRRSHGSTLPPDVLHELRKDAKKLRYLLDAFAGLYPRKRVQPLLGPLKRLQSSAGAICDRWAHATLLAGWRDASTDTTVHALFDAALAAQAVPAAVELAHPPHRALARALDALCDERGLDSLRRLCDNGPR